MEFSHLDKDGNAVMVDVSAKPMVRRTARAEGKIFMSSETINLIKEKLIKKGDVLTVAKIAGITAGKKTSDLIPLCHNISIDQISVELQIKEKFILITAGSVCTDKTGIEMEALTAVSVAALTVYDMCKAVDKKMEIGDIKLLEKHKETI
ncbi:MAG: cyclic pyranopterin monophosphate synthase MoaC [Spirochaetes bacterium]|nr:MAG: cyclic pyranopterin monophosphate synthase MoaC [Spirochaetota bacterium]